MYAISDVTGDNEQCKHHIYVYIYIERERERERDKERQGDRHIERET